MRGSGTQRNYTSIAFIVDQNQEEAEREDATIATYKRPEMMPKKIAALVGKFWLHLLLDDSDRTVRYTAGGA